MYVEMAKAGIGTIIDMHMRMTQLRKGKNFTSMLLTKGICLQINWCKSIFDALEEKRRRYSMSGFIRINRKDKTK